jgi:8-oxo-dGTP pyrophosphatase MutT (NUDIX family)
MIRAWKELRSEKLADYRVFSVRRKDCVSPRTGATHDFFVLDAANWVNVVALTPEGNMILIEQYRHGSETVELEIPGGVIDPEDPSPVAAGCRELREETGYVGENARLIGDVFPNPAIMRNNCYTVLIENCRKTSGLDFDAGEDIATRLIPADQVAPLAFEGKIRHSLVIAALFYFEQWRKNQRQTA